MTSHVRDEPPNSTMRFTCSGWRAAKASAPAGPLLVAAVRLGQVRERLLANDDVVLDGRRSSQSIGDCQPDVLGAHIDEGEHQGQTGTENTARRRATIIGPFIRAGAGGAARGTPVERD